MKRFLAAVVAVTTALATYSMRKRFNKHNNR